MPGKIPAIAVKDLRTIFTNPFSLVMMLAAPLFITGLLYFAFSGIGDEGRLLPDITLAVVNSDEGSPVFSAGDMLVSLLSEDEFEGFISSRPMDSPESARRAVVDGEVTAALIIPPGFTRRVTGIHSHDAERADSSDGTAEPPVLYHDPAATIEPEMIELVITSFLDAFTGAFAAVTTAEAMTAQTIDGGPSGAISRIVLNRYLESVSAGDREGNLRAAVTVESAVPTGGAGEEKDITIGLVMAGMIIFFLFFMGANSAQSILLEKENGTLARLTTTPAGRTAILSGKLLGVVGILISQVVLLLGASRLLFGIRWGGITAVAPAAAAAVLCASGFGIFIISLLKNTRQAGPVLGGALTVLGMFGGLFTVAVPDMPDFFQKTTLFVPQGWAMRVFAGILERGDLSGPDTMTFLGVLVISGAVFFVFGTVIFGRRMARG